MKKNSINTSKGITMISLVVTIIVILILAGVSISAMVGENGIFDMAISAKDATNYKDAREKVEVAILASYGNSGKLNDEKLKKNINKIEGLENPITAVVYNVKIVVDGFSFSINQQGDINSSEIPRTIATISTSETTPLEDIVPTMTEGNNVTLSDDIDYTTKYTKINGVTAGHTMYFPDNSTLNLGGKTITTTNFGVSYCGDNLNVKNGTFATAQDQSYSLFFWDNDKIMNNITVKDITCEGGVCMYRAQNVVFKNCNITAHKYYAIYGNTLCSMTVESGTYTASSISPALFGYCAKDGAETNPSNGFVIKGGTFITNGKPFCLTSGHYPPIIYGGTFDCNVSSYVADGYEAVNKGNGTWVVQKSE